MARVRFAPSPTGSLHLGNALSAVANRRLGDWMLLRIDDTDPTRNVPDGEAAILRDLEWLGIAWDEGPVRQSERAERHREAGAPLGDRFDGLTLLREDGSPTYHLASVVDDIDFGITHVVRGNDHRPNEELHRRLFEALGATPPEFVHHGLILGPDGRKLAKRAPGASVASLRDEGIPAEAVRAYLEELGLPRHDVHLDLARVRRLSIETLGALSDEELAARVGVPGLGGAGAARCAGSRRGAGVCRARARAGAGRGRRARDARPRARARRSGPRAAGDRPGAEGGRRRPEVAASRPHRSGPRARARRRDCRAAARRAAL